MIDIGPQALDAWRCVAGSLGQRRFSGNLRDFVAEPWFKILEIWFGFELPQPPTLFQRCTTRFFLNGIDRGDAHDHLFQNGGPLGLLDDDELSASMRHAGDFAYTASLIELLEAGIPVRMHPTGIVLEIVDCSDAFAVVAKLIPVSGLRIAKPGLLIPDIGPKSRCLDPARTRHQHLDQSAVGKDRLVALKMSADEI